MSTSKQTSQPVEKSFSERVAEAKAAVAGISPQAARQAIEQDPNTVVLDPRDASGIAESTGLIPGALNVTLATLNQSTENELDEMFRSRSRPVITACQAGPMGALAAHALKKRGYTNVRFMDGGTQAWLDAGYQTIR